MSLHPIIIGYVGVFVNDFIYLEIEGRLSNHTPHQNLYLFLSLIPIGVRGVL